MEKSGGGERTRSSIYILFALENTMNYVIERTIIFRLLLSVRLKGWRVLSRSPPFLRSPISNFSARLVGFGRTKFYNISLEIASNPFGDPSSISPLSLAFKISQFPPPHRLRIFRLLHLRLIHWVTVVGTLGQRDLR